MSVRDLRVWVLPGCLVVGWFILAQGWSPAVVRAEDSKTESDSANSPQAMAQRVDALIAERWELEKVKPAAPASDAEFMRRAYLDLTGVVPTVGQARMFLNQSKENRRAELIESLLTRPTYAQHMANTWRNFLLPQSFDARRFGGGTQFENWLADKFADNAPYDVLARELVEATGQFNQSGPVLYYTALEGKPEELAASTSRAFLGVQISCAQCHNHPFDHWTQRDFWGFAAFFARLQRPGNAQNRFLTQVMDGNEGEVTLPATGEVVPPTFLGGRGNSVETASGSEKTRRQQLADWMTAPENPFFARAATNRIWALLFGRGLVEPIDDLGSHNPASHPELLDELAAYFTANNYDVRNMIQTLAMTQAYQLSSMSAEGDEDRPELFARMAIKTLTAEQLYDCLSQATVKREFNTQQTFGRGNQSRLTFINKFRAPGGSVTDYQNGVAQALILMNGADVRNATDLQQSDILVALTAPFFSDDERLETLFLSTLSRLPDDEEREKFGNYVHRAIGTQAKREALGDILWALLNTAEFSLNH